MVINHLDEQLARKLADEAVAICAGDGMKTRDGSRRRTVGGVFFELARNRLPRDVRRIVFTTNHRLSENGGLSRTTIILLRIATHANRRFSPLDRTSS